MRFLRWVARLLSNSRRLGVGFLAAIGGLLTQLSGRAVIWIAGLILVAGGGWEISREATLFLLGLLLLRDAERKPSDES